MADGEARVHWAPWAAKWLEEAQRIREARERFERNCPRSVPKATP